MVFILIKKKASNNQSFFSFNAPKNPSSCDYVLCHIPASISLFPEEPYILSQTTPSLVWWQNSLFSFRYSCQTVANPAEQLVQSHPTNVSTYIGLPDRSASILRSSMLSDSLIPQWMREGEITIHIPLSLLFHIHKTSHHLDIVSSPNQNVRPNDELNKLQLPHISYILSMSLHPVALVFCHFWFIADPI